MFEILMFLMEKYIHFFEHSRSDEEEHEHYRSVAKELAESGFETSDIIAALTWLKDLNEHRNDNDTQCRPGSQSIRVLVPEEQYKLGPACQRFLLYLEQIKVLSPRVREIVIERAMALRVSQVALEEIKWITVLILFHQLDREQDENWLDNLMLAESRLETRH